jgi:SnoaL-like domain
MDHAGLMRWAEAYEAAWRSPGTGALERLFTADVAYLPSPWSAPVTGRSALARFWEAERDGPAEVFTMRAEPVAVEGTTAVVRVHVEYASPPAAWRDLWVIEFDDDGRCARFEEWPFASAQPDGH